MFTEPGYDGGILGLLKKNINNAPHYLVNAKFEPGNYKLNTPVTCSGCFQPNPSVIAQKGSVSMEKNTPWRFYDGPVAVYI